MAGSPRLRLGILIVVTGCGASSLPSAGGADAAAPRVDGSVADAAIHDDAASGTVPQQIVFMTAYDSGQGGSNSQAEIALVNLDGTGFRQLTNDGKFKFLPHFSPDGRTLVYTKYSVGSYGTANSRSDIALYDLATGTERLLTTTGGASQGTFSPDGKRVAYGSGTLTQGGTAAPGLYVVNVDGTGETRIGQWSGAADDQQWGDFAWSSDDWILFAVAQTVNGCFKVRLDKMRPDGTSRTQVTDGGPNCTPSGFEQSGDADPGWSHDGGTIYTSRGFPRLPAGAPDAGMPVPTERRLYAVSSDAWYAGKPESDLSLPSEPDCIEGVPKGSPDGTRVLLFRTCFDGGAASRAGIYVSDASGSYRTFVIAGFGPDWNPAAR